MNTTDLLNLGVDPDELYAPSGRCYGPAYPDSHGCGRFTSGGMCDRCQEETRRHWHVDEALQREWEDAQIAKELELEAAYHEAERAAHPDTDEVCAFCGAMARCCWDTYQYRCIDRDACDQRCYAAHERNLGFQAEREQSREEVER